DIYSLGIVLYQMITGRLPFQGSFTAVLHQIGSAQPARPSTLAPAITEDSPLERICLKMMAKSPNDRESGGARTLTQAGTGKLLLSGADPYTGGTVLTVGTLLVGNNSALGSGTLSLNGGTLSASGAAISLPNAVTLGGNATISGSQNLMFTARATLTGN